MGIVTMQAMVTAPAPLRQIPVPCHASVRSMLIVTELCPMTLSTERHRLLKGNRSTIRQFQRRVPVTRLMTADTGQLAMGDLQPLVKLVQF